MHFILKKDRFELTEEGQKPMTGHHILAENNITSVEEFSEQNPIEFTRKDVIDLLFQKLVDYKKDLCKKQKNIETDLLDEFNDAKKMKEDYVSEYTKLCFKPKIDQINEILKSINPSLYIKISPSYVYAADTDKGVKFELLSEGEHNSYSQKPTPIPLAKEYLATLSELKEEAERKDTLHTVQKKKVERLQKEIADLNIHTNSDKIKALIDTSLAQLGTENSKNLIKIISDLEETINTPKVLYDADPFFTEQPIAGVV